ncbi:hypothetical protein K9L67_00535 [Candidatus Woesearchaeota archaeon]|nr:hypothetical protein [Candidatus Woesearchaeota archaeon]MCF7900693.1 hypothetical protein [Candidatus Woesearchaeota archaeon]MCF8013214.1 hypothetical protein [Candidatus Woesearchaeota archaeon]
MQYQSQKLKIIISIVSIIIIAIIIILLTPTKKLNENETNQTSNKKLQIEDAIERKIANDDLFLYASAKGENNNIFCQGISSEELKIKCFDEIRESKEIHIDNTTKEERNDHFLYQNALNTNIIEFCQEITNLSLKNKCITELKLNKQEIELPIELIKNNTNISIEEITQKKSDSEDAFLYQNAKASNEPQFCNGIINQELKQQCISELSK